MTTSRAVKVRKNVVKKSLTSKSGKNIGSNNKNVKLASISQCKKVKLVEHVLTENGSHGHSSLDFALASFISKLPNSHGETTGKILHSIYGILKSKNVTFPMRDIINNLGELINKNIKQKYKELLFDIFEFLCKNFTQNIENHFDELSLYINYSLHQPSEEIQKFALSFSIMILKFINLKNIKISTSIIDGLMNIIIANSSIWCGRLSEFRLQIYELSNKSSKGGNSIETVLIPAFTLIKTLLNSFIQQDSTSIANSSINELNVFEFLNYSQNDQKNSQPNSFKNHISVIAKFSDVNLDFFNSLVPDSLNKNNKKMEKSQQGTKIYPEVAILLSVLFENIFTFSKYFSSNSDLDSDFLVSSKIYQFILNFFNKNFPFFTSETSSSKFDSNENLQTFVSLNLNIIILLIDFNRKKCSLDSKTKTLIYSYLLKVLSIGIIDNKFIDIMKKLIELNLFPEKPIENLSKAIIAIFPKLKLTFEQHLDLHKIIAHSKIDVDIEKFIDSSESQKNQLNKYLLLQSTYQNENSQRKWFYDSLTQNVFQFEKDMVQIISLNIPQNQTEFYKILSLIDHTKSILNFELLFDLVSVLYDLTSTENILNLKLFFYLVFFEPLTRSNSNSKINRANFQLSIVYFLHLKSSQKLFLTEILNYLSEFKPEEIFFETFHSAKLLKAILPEQNHSLEQIISKAPSSIKVLFDEYLKEEKEIPNLLQQILIDC